MKVSVLVDNTALIDRYYLAEPALALYLEDGDDRVLFDTGYSDLLLRNAAALGIDLARVASIVLSHGHNDHTGGLVSLRQAGLMAGKTLVAHPEALAPKWDGDEAIGSPLNADHAAQVARLRLTREPLLIGDRLIFLGEIPRRFAFEPPLAVGRGADGQTPDFLPDDSALAYRGDQGLFIFTGCSHSGLCNIVAHAREVCGERRIAGIVGGFHLFECDARLEQTVHYLAQQGVGCVYPCHCVSLAAKCALFHALPVGEIGVGSVLDIP